MNQVNFRPATRQDLPDIVRMLADDELGSQREKCEDPLPEPYYIAFEQINRNADHRLIVAELDGKVIGTLHLIFLPSISYRGGLRAQVESVRVDRQYQNLGIGSEMMKWTIARAKEDGARMVQLTTHRTRQAAHRFYERLGFKGNHLGMKLDLG